MNIKRSLQYFYLKILRIHDTPHRIALGIFSGIFSGVLPGAGPIFSLILAFILRANKAAALLGCIVVNTWISLVVLIPAMKIGSAICGIGFQELKKNVNGLRENFSFSDLMQVSFFNVLLPLMLGLCIVSAIIGIGAYIVSYGAITNFRKMKEKRKRKKMQKNNAQHVPLEDKLV